MNGDSTMFGKLWKVFVSKMKLMEMDRQWYLMGASALGFSSFFFTRIRRRRSKGVRMKL